MTDQTAAESLQDDGLLPGNECILRTRDLRLSYGRHLAVDGLSLNVRRGEIYGFLGRNGAGKTSTIRMIMGIGVADAGTIEFNGQVLRRIGNNEKRQIGYVSQEQFFYPWMTCQRIGKFVGGLFPTWDSDEFLRLMTVLDLPLKRKIAHLSGGMKVKLALALALSHRPEILVLDEPTAGLDPVARREFLDIIRRQAQQMGRTTFFSSHLIDEVERVSDTVGIIHRGRLRFEGPLDELAKQVREVPAEMLTLGDTPEQHMENLALPPSWSNESESQGLGLHFLGPGLDGRLTQLFQGTPEAWQQAAERGIVSETLSLEDAFVALARDEVRAI